jgi:hypothetical protein
MSDQEEPLEYGLISDIPNSKARYERLVQFHWQFYSHLAYLRNQIYDSLKNALRERTTAFQFSGWQRAVKYKYSLNPLSTRGSLSDPGGRFNIGAIDTTRYAPFPALYLASDKGTALAELLGRDGGGDSLTPEELALTKAESVAAISVSGKLESVLDVRERSNLLSFVNLIRDFKPPKALITQARKLGLPTLRLVRTVGQLTKELRTANWRNWPMLFDAPSPSQIFGRIVLDAGIEGILYSSVLTEKACLALYPQNFQSSPSFVELDDPLPAENVPARIDAATFRNFL